MNHDNVDLLQRDWDRARPDLDSEPMGVILRIQALARILEDQASARLEEFDLLYWQYDVLSALRRQGPPYTLAASELADEVAISSGAMTNRIDGLEQDELVTRLMDPLDRRKVLVCLTDKGLRLIEEAAEARFDAAFQALDTLSPPQREQLSSLLRMVLGAQDPS